MSAAFWSTAIVVGIVQGLFLGVTLLLKRHTNRRAARWLALLVCALAMGMLAGRLGTMLPAVAALLVVFVNINTELTFGPLLFLFVRSVVDPDRRWRFADTVHFLPFAVCVSTWSASWFFISDPAGLLYAGLDSLDGAGFFLAFKAFVLFTYVIASCRLLSRTTDAAGHQGSGQRSLDIDWLRRWIIRLSAIPAAIYLLTVLEQWHLAAVIEADEIGGLLVTVIVFLAASMILIRPSVLTAKRAANGWTATDTARVTACLEQERPWLDPELGLGGLAATLGMTQNQLSAVINEGLGTTFYALLNRYRLDEFRRLAGEPALRQRSVLELAFTAGFNSKASFYRAFRVAFGVTPTAFRRERMGACNRSR
jgi:AraC-like DNA-binding protein